MRPAPRSDPCLTILLLLWIVMPPAAVSALATGKAAGPAAPTRASVNPNLAPWWELTVLPRIGTGRAHEIVRYRKSVADASTGNRRDPPFGCAADLTQVRGIGPKTIQRISPHLGF